MFELFIYINSNPRRIPDFKFCLSKNIENPRINSINILSEAALPVISEMPKVRKFKVTRWPSYKDFFDIANEYYTGKHIIVSNADIFFDETLAHLDGFSLKGVFLHLTRKEVNGNPEDLNFFGQGLGAGDSWFFQAPCWTKLSHTKIGTPYCDHIIWQGAAKAGYRVFNPCLNINGWHKHPMRDYHTDNRLYNEVLSYHGVSTGKDLDSRYDIKTWHFVKFCTVKQMRTALSKRIKLS
jgi:hypothetical protein